MSARQRQVKAVFRTLLGVLMVLAGAMHFLNPELYLAMMPDYLPLHAAAVYVSGVVEIALGIALFVPKTRALAGWGLIALYLAVLPANIWMATEGVQPPGLEMSPTAAWLRLPIQGVLMFWAWAVSRPNADAEATSPDSE
ncbi:hypothetical protein DB30_01147 [Enhygromyxa salina]|uniref:Methylamine utilisation protein MauE domain-containing protein n=1 Tax=Enhygromyxa salina TaxID=215803 RepID=A0A0C1Z4T2_9BACT|nr:MauE/DoxX family redox-associated membrane protein [Enhygromyxa salina]KIG12659.1 hypothetical protein DB30_01147 [Enhygromyxa salina]